MQNPQWGDETVELLVDLIANVHFTRRTRDGVVGTFTITDEMADRLAMWRAEFEDDEDSHDTEIDYRDAAKGEEKQPKKPTRRIKRGKARRAKH